MGGLVEDVVSVAIFPGSGWDLQEGTDQGSNQEIEPKGHGMSEAAKEPLGRGGHRGQNMAGARARPQLGEEKETQEEESQEEGELELEWQMAEPIPTPLGTSIPSYTSPLWTYDQEVQLETCTPALN